MTVGLIICCKCPNGQGLRVPDSAQTEKTLPRTALIGHCCRQKNLAASCLVTTVSVFLWAHHVAVPSRLRCLGSRHPNPQTSYSTLSLAHCCVIYTQPLPTDNSCKIRSPFQIRNSAVTDCVEIVELKFFVTCSCLWDELESCFIFLFNDSLKCQGGADFAPWDCVCVCIHLCCG